MSRVFKCSNFKIELFIPNLTDASTTENLKISLYTNDHEISADFTEGFEFNGNIVKFIVPAESLCNMNDGVLKYFIEGVIDGNTFMIERQSNYYLKSPSEYGKYPELTEITITENGTYEGAFNKVIVDVSQEGGECNLQERWVGYNHPDELTDGAFVDVSPEEGFDGMTRVVADVRGIMNNKYEEGYNQGKAEGGDCSEIIDNARVIEITENGSYLSQYSDPIEPQITGVYNNGDKFHNYAKIDNAVYDTGYRPTPNSKMTIWWKNDKFSDSTSILAYQYWDGIIFKIQESLIDGKPAILGGIQYDNKVVEYDIDKWHKIELSFADGFLVDDVKVGEYSDNIYSEAENTLKINGGSDVEGNSNGYFGMIVIDGHTLIPTENGWYDIDKDEYLQQVQEGTYEFFEVRTLEPEGDLYKTIIVDVQTKPKTQVLEITEPGSYVSDYGMPEETNPDGGHNYVEVYNSTFNTGIYAKPDTRLEFWWKWNGNVDSNEANIVGSHQWGIADSMFKVAYCLYGGFVATINDYGIRFDIPNDGKFHHFVMSYADGLWIDDVKIGDFLGGNITGTEYEPICINGYYYNDFANSDYYGAIKIDGGVNHDIFYPSDCGFSNIWGYCVEQIRWGYHQYRNIDDTLRPVGNLIERVDVNIDARNIVEKCIDTNEIEKDDKYMYIQANPDEAFDYVEINYVPLKEQLKSQFKEKNTTGITITENGTYKLEPIKAMTFDGDDIFDTGYLNRQQLGIEIKFVPRNRYTLIGANDDNNGFQGIQISVENFEITWGPYYNNDIPIKWDEINTIKLSPYEDRDTMEFPYQLEVNGVGYDMYRNWWYDGTPDYPVILGEYLGYSGEKFLFIEMKIWEDVSLADDTPTTYLPINNNVITKIDKYGNETELYQLGDGFGGIYDFYPLVGYSEVNVNIPPTPKYLESFINECNSREQTWVTELDVKNHNTLAKTTRGLMYDNDYFKGLSLGIWDGSDNVRLLLGGVNITNYTILQKPFVYDESLSLGDFKVIPKYWCEGFINCQNIEELDNVFEGAEEMEYIGKLDRLGENLQENQTLDFSTTNLSNESLIDIAKSVYNFRVNGPNNKGVSTANVRFNSNVDEQVAVYWRDIGWNQVD